MYIHLGIRLYKDNVIALLAYRYLGRLGNVGSDLQGCVEQMTTWNVRVSREKVAHEYCITTTCNLKECRLPM